MTGRVRTLQASATSISDHYARGDRREAHDRVWEPFWFGRGAAALGLEGVPSKRQIRALMNATHPVSGEKLGNAYAKTTTGKRRAARGYDLTLAVPKDVSVLWALENEQVGSEIEHAVRAASIAVLERLDASPPIRTKEELVAGVGIAAAVFPEYTSLLGDPGLHVRCAVSSKVRHRKSGKWYALDARELMQDQQAYSALFHRGLEAELSTRLHVGWAGRDPEARGFGTPLAGANARLCGAFSGRTIDVEDAFNSKVERFQAAIGREASPKEQARLKREAAKGAQLRPPEVDVATARVRWRQIAAQITGAQNNYIDAVAKDRAEPIEFSTQVLQEATDAAVEKLDENRSAWRRGHLVTEIARHLPAGLNVDARTLISIVEEAATRVLASPRIVLVSAPSGYVAADGLIDPLTTYSTTQTPTEPVDPKEGDYR